MNTAWLRHIKDDDEREHFLRSLMSSRTVLDRLYDLLKEQENQIDRSENDSKTYDIPGWAYKQAHKNGYRSCLSFIYKLIDLDQQKD